jgi:hypothetical protein
MIICGKEQEDCVFHKSKALRSIARKVHKCEFNGVTEGQFAAVDAFIASMDLPYIDSDGMMSAPCQDFKACKDDDISLVSTLISLVSSYKQIRNVIVFDDNIVSAQCVVKSVNAGITCTISIAKGKKHEYILNVSTMLEPLTIKQAQLMAILKMLMEVDYSLTWIASSKSMELATVLQRKSTNMWVNNTGTATDSVSLTGSYGTRILPMMYTLPTIGNVVSVNFGSPSPNLTSRVEDTSMRLNTVVSQTINVSTKNRKCYYCTLMETIHEDVCHSGTITDNNYIFTFSDVINEILTG